MNFCIPEISIFYILYQFSLVLLHKFFYNFFKTLKPNLLSYLKKFLYYRYSQTFRKNMFRL
jgi:hypothetical protein